MTKNIKGNAPTHHAFVVDEYAKGKSFWTRIGSGWPHEDGEGMTVDIIPGISVQGRLVLRIVKEKTETDGE